MMLKTALPQLSHQQIKVLSCLENGSFDATALQKQLTELGWAGVRSSFTNLMKPLVKDGLVEARRKTFRTERGAKTYVVYSIRPDGKDTLAEARNFYKKPDEAELTVPPASHLVPTIERLVDSLPFMSFENGASPPEIRRLYKTSIRMPDDCHASISVLTEEILRASLDNQVVHCPVDVEALLRQNVDASLRGLAADEDEPLRSLKQRSAVLDTMSKNIGCRCRLLSENLATVLERLRGAESWDSTSGETSS